jgi:SAM-dependent methyltransferase
MDYWNERYADGEAKLDMHASYEDIKSSLKVTNKLGRILVPGCGNSPFSNDLYKAGYRNQINLDFCPRVISQMQQRSPHLQWVIGNGTKMTSFCDGYFDTVVDKALLDTLSCSEDEHAQNLFIKEVFRLLTPGGIYVCVSIQNPESVMEMLTPVFGKGARWYPLRNENGAADIQRFVAICRKPMVDVGSTSTVERIQQLINLKKTGREESMQRRRALAKEKCIYGGTNNNDTDTNDDADEKEHGNIDDDDDDDDDDSDAEYEYSLTERYKIELRKLFHKDPEVCGPYLDPNFWQSSFGGSTAQAEAAAKGQANSSGADDVMGVTDQGPKVGLEKYNYTSPVIVSSNSHLQTDMQNLIDQ